MDVPRDENGLVQVVCGAPNVHADMWAIWLPPKSEIHSKNMSFEEEADIDLLADLTDGLSGADLKAVCTEAGMFAIREKRDAITVSNFMDAVNKVMSKNTENEFNLEPGVMFG